MNGYLIVVWICRTMAGLTTYKGTSIRNIIEAYVVPLSSSP